MSKIKMIVLFGEAGAGKDTCLHQVCKVLDGVVHEVVSTTTRPPRQGEVDGKSYHFMSKEAFEAHKQAGDFIETSEFRGWHYGTAWADLDWRKVNIVVLNPDGIRSIDAEVRRGTVDATYIWIQASPKNRLLRQLNREKKPDCDEIIRRYGTDKADFAPFYNGALPNTIIVNNDYLDVAEVCKPIVTIATNMANEVA